MKKIALSDQRELALERYEKARLRMIVLRNGEVWVCRKESFSKLKQFMQHNHAHIFKGRLQLTKHLNQINVTVKGENIGMIDAGWLEKSMLQLSAQKWQPLP